ncbi:MAG: hypothetical protein HFJ95_05330 [Muribaculaceae bacterium]|nr:hypothetical protein [Muribaculaceae bacterium]
MTVWLKYVGQTGNKIYKYNPEGGDDLVLIAVDARQNYLTPDMESVPTVKTKVEPKDLTE